MSLDHQSRGKRSSGQVRHVRTLGLCLVAALALFAVAATSASALPEFGECYKKGTGGKYTESNCVKKASAKSPGEFEWRKVSEISKEERQIAGLSGPGDLKAVIHLCPSFKNEEKCAEGGEEIPVSVECANQENLGEISGPKELKNVSVTFQGCALFGAIPCANTTNVGEITVNPLKGKLGWINKSAKPRQVGIVLEPIAKKGEFANFDCGGETSTHVGEATKAEFPAYPPNGGGDGIISPIAPVNTMSSEFIQEFKVNEADANIPDKFEGTSPLKALESWIGNPHFPEEHSKWAAAGEELTNIERNCKAPHIRFPCAHSEEEATKPGEIKAN